MKYKKAWISLIILAILTPLGLIAIGEAWGEWDNETIQKIVGFVPEGMSRIKDYSISIFRDYTIPGLNDGTPKVIFGTILSAFIGAGLTAVITLILVRVSRIRKKA